MIETKNQHMSLFKKQNCARPLVAKPIITQPADGKADSKKKSLGQWPAHDTGHAGTPPKQRMRREYLRT